MAAAAHDGASQPGRRMALARPALEAEGLARGRPAGGQIVLLPAPNPPDASVLQVRRLAGPRGEAGGWLLASGALACLRRSRRRWASGGEGVLPNLAGTGDAEHMPTDLTVYQAAQKVLEAIAAQVFTLYVREARGAMRALERSGTGVRRLADVGASIRLFSATAISSRTDGVPPVVLGMTSARWASATVALCPSRLCSDQLVNGYMAIVVWGIVRRCCSRSMHGPA